MLWTSQESNSKLWHWGDFMMKAWMSGVFLNLVFRCMYVSSICIYDNTINRQLWELGILLSAAFLSFFIFKAIEENCVLWTVSSIINWAVLSHQSRMLFRHQGTVKFPWSLFGSYLDKLEIQPDFTSLHPACLYICKTSIPWVLLAYW